MKDSGWGSRLSPVPLHWKIVQVCMADQAMYHQGDQSVFVGGRLRALLAPAAIWKKENCRSFTSIQMLHTHTIPRTTLSHTIPRTQSFTHTHTHTFCHTHTHNLSHTHTQLCHTQSFIHSFVTHHLSHKPLSHTLSLHTLFHTNLSHNSFTHSHPQLCHTLSITHNFLMHNHVTHTLDKIGSLKRSIRNWVL